MNIFITGSSGLIGTELCHKLDCQNYKLFKLQRLDQPIRSNAPDWDINVTNENKPVYANTYIHLAGENIAAKRWNEVQKSKIYSSRIQGTKNLVNQIIASPQKPQLFICASAIGFYGNRTNETLDENSCVGQDFVSKVSQDWEQATLPLLEHGIRVVNLRFGVILSKKGGALKKMLFPFQLGLGGKIGLGTQKFSWVHSEDAINAIVFIIHNNKISGPVNISSSKPITNLVYTKTLGKTINRPTFFNMPAFICRLLFGEMADELLLSSQHVLPKKLIKHNFKFTHSDIQSALSDLLK